MPHGALIQARQVAVLARYLPRWQQNVLAVSLLAGGIALIVLGDLVGITPLMFVAVFAVARFRERSHRTSRPNR